MSVVSKASFLGERGQIAVERALSEFRSGRPVLTTSASDAIAALPVDGMTEANLVAFRLLSRPVDANSVLGFDDDERDYGIAVRMLQMLGCPRVRLMTNNPSKIDGLSRAGIDVSGRVPLHGPINADNRRYLAAKATRAGHQLDHVLGALAEPGGILRDP